MSMSYFMKGFCGCYKGLPKSTVSPCYLSFLRGIHGEQTVRNTIQDPDVFTYIESGTEGSRVLRRLRLPLIIY